MERAGSHRETPAGRLRINASAGAARQMEPIVFEYPPDLQDAAVQTVLRQAEALSAMWAV
jgi:hypothetical protein